MTAIRRYRPADWPAIWPLLQATFAAGDTYAFAPDSSEADIHRAWVQTPTATFVACATNDNARDRDGDPDGRVVGTYFVKPNQPGLGAHVCNCGYVVAPDAQRRGIASAMCVHSQQQALALGFVAMQFNLVVATNDGAVRLWQTLGFAVVGTLPRAFRHQRLGLVDAFVMFKELAG